MGDWEVRNQEEGKANRKVHYGTDHDPSCVQSGGGKGVRALQLQTARVSSCQGCTCMGEAACFPHTPRGEGLGKRMQCGTAGRGSSWPLGNIWRKPNVLKGVRSL